MIEMRSQPTSKGSTASTNEEICDHVLGTKSCYVKGLGYEIKALSSSCSSMTDIHATCDARLVEI